MNNVIAIIPARGGSKRLPGKNLLKLRGMSLVARAIHQAQEAQLPRVVVVTDSGLIVSEASAHGAQVILESPIVAQDDTPMVTVLRHVVDHLEKYEVPFRAGVIVLLQPTSPLRTAEDILGALKLYQSGDCDSVTSVCRGKENGAVYVTHANLIKQGTIYGPQLRQYEMPEERSVDINTQEDFDEAERRIKGDHSGVLLQLARPGRGKGNDKGGPRHRGRPRKS